MFACAGSARNPRGVATGAHGLGLLAGHRRYAHITALRGDAVAAQALGMAKVVSEDALRRALARIDEASSAGWMRPSLMHSVRQALDRPWVLDIDASIKPLYGRQEGAEIGYNPTKPMRPSHVLHTFPVSNLRLVLHVQLSSGRQHTGVHAKAALGRLLDELGERRLAPGEGDVLVSGASDAARWSPVDGSRARPGWNAATPGGAWPGGRGAAAMGASAATGAAARTPPAPRTATAAAP